MKNKPILGIALFILFSTFIPQNKFTINKFEIKEIKIENNKILKDQELIKIFSFLYNQNIIFLNTYEIKKKISQKSFIKSFEIKKIYPNKLVVKVFEEKPIAIIFENNNKYFLGKKINLIEYLEIDSYKNLPKIYGNRENFKTLYRVLKKINFPSEIILEYYLFNSKRWNIRLANDKIIKLPIKDYKQSLKNFMQIRTNRSFDKYKIFDYRIKDQLILK